MMKVVISSLLLFILICQYSLARSNEVNYLTPLKLAMISSCHGIGYLFHFVLGLSFLKSKHIRLSFIFFATMTISETQRLADSLTIPHFKRSSNSLLSQILFR